MHHAERYAALRGVAAGTWVVLGMLVLSTPVQAADAHKAVQAQHGEIVMLRNVSARPAYREASPGTALIVNPSPRRELDGALDTGELSDDDYANLNATASTGSHRAHGTTVERITDNALGGSVGTRASAGGVTSNGFSNVIAAPMSGIGRATGSIENQVQGALSLMPGFSPPSPPGH